MSEQPRPWVPRNLGEGDLQDQIFDLTVQVKALKTLLVLIVQLFPEGEGIVLEQSLIGNAALVSEERKKATSEGDGDGERGVDSLSDIFLSKLHRYLIELSIEVGAITRSRHN